MREVTSTIGERRATTLIQGTRRGQSPTALGNNRSWGTSPASARASSCGGMLAVDLDRTQQVLQQVAYHAITAHVGVLHRTLVAIDLHVFLLQVRQGEGNRRV